MLPLLKKLLEVKKPSSGLPGSLLAQYKAVGLAGGFRTEPIEKGLLFMGKTVTLALKIEFGNRWEFFNTITSLRETDADIKVLVTSSNSKSMPMETVYTVLKKKLEEKKRWAIMDIEGKKGPMFLNFSASDLGAKPPVRSPRPRKTVPSRPVHKPAPQPEQKIQKHSTSPKEEKGPLSFLKKLPFFKSSAKGRGGEPVEMKKTKNYGMQPVSAKPRRKKIYGKRRKNKS